MSDIYSSEVHDIQSIPLPEQTQRRLELERKALTEDLPEAGDDVDQGSQGPENEEIEETTSRSDLMKNIQYYHATLDFGVVELDMKVCGVSGKKETPITCLLQDQNRLPVKLKIGQELKLSVSGFFQPRSVLYLGFYSFDLSPYTILCFLNQEVEND